MGKTFIEDLLYAPDFMARQTFIEYLLYALDLMARFHESSAEIRSSGLGVKNLSSMYERSYGFDPSTPKERWCCFHFHSYCDELR